MKAQDPENDEGQKVSIARNITLLQTELYRVEKGLADLANFTPIERHFAAICARFQTMSSHDRTAAVEELLEQKDGPTLAALVDAPLVVTGLSAQERDGVRSRLYERIDPAAFAALQRLESLIARLERSLAGDNEGPSNSPIEQRISKAETSLASKHVQSAVK